MAQGDWSTYGNIPRSGGGLSGCGAERSVLLPEAEAGCRMQQRRDTATATCRSRSWAHQFSGGGLELGACSPSGTALPPPPHHPRQDQMLTWKRRVSRARLPRAWKRTAWVGEEDAPGKGCGGGFAFAESPKSGNSATGGMVILLPSASCAWACYKKRDDMRKLNVYSHLCHKVTHPS